MVEPSQVLDVIRRLPGSWRLPIRPDESITITFFPNGHFFWTVSAYSLSKRAIQIGTGPDWHGNWHIRSDRAPSSTASSANALRSSFDLSTSEVPNRPGPYLVLNFTELTTSILNFQLLGFRVSLANWINAFAQMARDGHYRILDFSKSEMRLEGPNEEVEIWHRASDNFA